MKKIIVVILGLIGLFLIGCATMPHVVNVPVAVVVPCKAAQDLGPDPAYPDTDDALKTAPDVFEAAKLLLEGRLMRIQRDAEKTAALNACASVGQ